MKEIIIRDKIKVTDIGQIVLFHAESYSQKYGWNEEFEAYVAKPLAEFVLRKDKSEKIWVVEKDQEVKGAIALTKVTDKVAQLRWFSVVPELRRRGIGKKLMEHLVSFAEMKKYAEIISWTVSDLTEAITLYKKFDFKLEEEKKTHNLGKRGNRAEIC